jgi:uncharacterized protein (TIGR00730 family)
MRSKERPSSICVFCGSSSGVRIEYQIAAEQLGRLLAERDVTLVYGGGRVGLMGTLADAALAAGGRVVGVIPKQLCTKELAHRGVTELHVVETMSERKALMGELSDAFLALPGGIGTLDELFEVWTWTQLGLQRKLSGLLNVNGYFDPLLQFLQHAVSEGFLRSQHRDALLVGTHAETLVSSLLTDVTANR